jgi:hypothetical protein
LADPSDEITQTAIDIRLFCSISRFPTPKHLEASAMPPQDGLAPQRVGQSLVVNMNSARSRAVEKAVARAKRCRADNKETGFQL